MLQGQILENGLNILLIKKIQLSQELDAGYVIKISKPSKWEIAIDPHLGERRLDNGVNGVLFFRPKMGYWLDKKQYKLENLENLESLRTVDRTYLTSYLKVAKCGQGSCDTVSVSEQSSVKYQNVYLENNHGSEEEADNDDYHMDEDSAYPDLSTIHENLVDSIKNEINTYFLSGDLKWENYLFTSFKILIWYQFIQVLSKTASF